MTRVYLEQSGDRYCVRCKGHATGSAETCAAVSCLVYTLAGWLRNAAPTMHEARLDDGDASICFRGGEAAEAVFDMICVGFLQLQAQYGAFIQVELKII